MTVVKCEPHIEFTSSILVKSVNGYQAAESAVREIQHKLNIDVVMTIMVAEQLHVEEQGKDTVYRSVNSRHYKVTSTRTLKIDPC